MPPSSLSLSRTLSYVLHPLLIPTFASAALMFKPELYSILLPDALKIWFLTLVFVFTFAIPVTGVLVLLKFKVVDSLEMHTRNERTIPLILACTSFMVLLYSIKSTGIPPVFLYLLYSATFALVAGLLINLFYKISLHTLGWGAIAASLTGISIRLGMPMLVFIIPSVILSGLAGYARLKQNAHNQTQVYVGFAAGIAVILFLTLIG